MILKMSLSNISFPKTFLYSTSWEDPELDQKVLNISSNDSVLTITGGGDNVFHYILNKAKSVTCVDINIAQYHLMELKKALVEYCSFAKLWNLFGEGRDIKFSTFLEEDAINFLNEETYLFWKERAHYFNESIYYHGSMGKIVSFLKYYKLNWFFTNVNISKKSIIWNCMFYTCHVYVFIFLLFSKIVPLLWICCGVPTNQIRLIANDNRSMFEYITTSLKVFQFTDLIKNNYFYFLIMNGKFSKTNCPSYLKESNLPYMKENVSKIHNLNCSLVDVLKIQRFNKIILMDHMDWMDDIYIDMLCYHLHESLNENGKIIFKSSSLYPYFVDNIFVKKYNFCAKRINTHTENIALDRVNMYASFWLITKPTQTMP